MVALSTGEWIDLAVAVGTIGLAVAAFQQIVAEAWSRPRLALEPGVLGVHTRLEGRPPRPWIRLLVRNGDRRRTSAQTRVLIEHYRERTYATPPVSLGGPELGWPSTDLPEGGGAVVFGGTTRPLDFGALGAGPSNASPQGNVVAVMQVPNVLPEGFTWWFRFTLAMHAKSVFVGREFLPYLSGGYVATLTVGGDEGRARTFDVSFDWNGLAPTAAEALASFQLSISPSNRRGASVLAR